MTNSTKNTKPENRRRLLKTITFSSGVAVAMKGIPEVWESPLVRSAILPAHAVVSFAHTCSIPFNLTFAALPQSAPSIANVYSGTQSAGGPFFGDCSVTGIQFSELPLVVTITSEGGDNYRVNYNLDSGDFTYEFVTSITESNDAVMMGNATFEFDLFRVSNFNGFGTYEVTKYTYNISPEGNLSGTINGTLYVNEISFG